MEERGKKEEKNGRYYGIGRKWGDSCWMERNIGLGGKERKAKKGREGKE